FFMNPSFFMIVRSIVAIGLYAHGPPGSMREEPGGNVAAAGFSLKLNAIGRLVGALRGLGKVRAPPRGDENPPPRGDHLPLLDGRSRVENRDPGDGFGLLQPLDRKTRLVRAGIARRR